VPLDLCPGELHKSPLVLPSLPKMCRARPRFVGCVIILELPTINLTRFVQIGGVLNINQKFFVLTSAHPFQKKIGSTKEIDSESSLAISCCIEIAENSWDTY
jgi:hypothetical protein